MVKTLSLGYRVLESKLSKRQEFAAGSVFLTTLFLILTYFSESRYLSIFLFGMASYGISLYLLRENMTKTGMLVYLILPTGYSIAAMSVFFFLPGRIITRLPLSLIYAIGMYAIFLTENIFAVAAVSKNIQLLRAAHSVSFLFSLLVMFLLGNTILAFRQSGLVNFFAVGVIGFILLLQLLWFVSLPVKLERKIIIDSLIFALMLAECALALSFWPVDSTIGALFLTTFFYTTAGMAQQHLLNKLFKKTVYEFISVLAVVFFLIVVTTKWSGP